MKTYSYQMKEKEMAVNSRWNSREILYTHIKSDLFLKILQAMEMADEEPRISIGDTSREQSMDLIRKLRNCESKKIDEL